MGSCSFILFHIQFIHANLILLQFHKDLTHFIIDYTHSVKTVYHTTHTVLKQSTTLHFNSNMLFMPRNKGYITELGQFI